MNHARLFTDHDYWTMHDGDEIRFNLEDYQPYEPQSCLYEAYLFCDVSFIGLYRDYELEFEDQLSILTDLRENLISAYMNYPDGEVTVKLTIKEECVNL